MKGYDIMKKYYQKDETYQKIQNIIITSIDEWLKNYSNDFTRIENPDEIIWILKGGDYIKYSTYIDKKKIISGGEVRIGPETPNSNGYICLWSYFSEAIYFPDADHLENKLPHTELTPYVVKLIKIISKNIGWNIEKVFPLSLVPYL